MSFLLAASLLAQAAGSAPPPADLVDIVDAMAEERGDLTPVLVQGTSHLSSLPKDFPTERFDPLLDELEEWAPEAIAIEGIEINSPTGSTCGFSTVGANTRTAPPFSRT